MLLAVVLSLVTFAFCAYFLHLFFQLNRSERKLQSTLNEIEASMLNRYGRPRTPEEKEKEASHDDKPKSRGIEKKA